MKIKVQNSIVVSFANFLINVNLQGPASRMRTRLVNKVNDTWDRVQKELNDTTQEEAQAILDEYSFIDVSEYDQLVPVLLAGLENTTTELSGTDALVYDIVMTALEDSLEEEK